MGQIPPPPPVPHSSPTINCQWCNKPMDSAAINCPNCGRLRKDTYNNKILSYVFCIPAGLLIGFSFKFMGGHNQDNDFNTGTVSGGSTGTILLVIGIVLGIVGTYFYVKTSQQMKKWWWV